VFRKLTEFAESHPTLVEIFAAILVAEAIMNYHRVLNWAEGLEQIRASEALGG
jgi:hypothetical protein